jgi:hypothetical protein
VAETVDPAAINLRNVATGGKGASAVRKMKVLLQAEDAPGRKCNGNDASAPTLVNLRMVDDDGDVLVDSAKIAVCKARDRLPTTQSRDVFVQGPLNCPDSEVPAPPHATGDITATVSIAGQPDYVEAIRLKCSP